MNSVILLSLILAQPPAVPDGPPPVPELLEQPAPVIKTYAGMRREAIKNRLPLVVFIDCEERDVEGAYTVYVDSLAGFKGPSIVVSRPDQDELFFSRQWKANTATAVLLTKEVPAVQARPFSSKQLPPELTAQPDDSMSATGPWPTKTMIDGATKYAPTKATQSIFKFTGNPNGIIRGMHRSVAEEKYHVPGGLLGITGWRSELYKRGPVAKERLAFTTVTNSIPIGDGFGKQDEVSYQREYPDGAEFHDILVNTATNQVFEHRVAEKVDGKWSRYITYRDKQQRPKGYVPPRSAECVTCHLDAGSGKYGLGMVPGGDTIISDPFQDFPVVGEERQIPLRR